MILVFILLGIIIFITLLYFIILLSELKIEIQNFSMSNYKKVDNKKYKLIISLYFLNRFKILSFKLNDKKIKKIYSKMKLEKYDIRKIEKELNLKLNDIKYLKDLKLDIKYFKLKLAIGTEDVIVTSFAIFGLSTILSIILSKSVKSEELKNCYYEVRPLYMDKNVYRVEFNCIFNLKMVHIINIIKLLKKKGRSDNNERPSNRRSYEYSYE